MVANSALRDILLPLELGPIGLVPILVTPEQFKAAIDDLTSPGTSRLVLQNLAPLALVPPGDVVILSYVTFSVAYTGARSVIGVIPGAEDALGRAWLYFNLPTGY